MRALPALSSPHLAPTLRPQAGSPTRPIVEKEPNLHLEPVSSALQTAAACAALSSPGFASLSGFRSASEQGEEE